jgi:hypothetical protein
MSSVSRLEMYDKTIITANAARIRLVVNALVFIVLPKL